jgi:Ni/Co efflux regulator RcnB
MPMKKRAVSLLIASLLLPSAALADPPPGKGGGKKQDNAEWGDSKGKGKDRDRADSKRPDNGKGRADRDSGRDQPRSSVSVQRHFEDRHRAAVRDYYVTEYRSGHCPPGLAKKNNGCMPPGQAKKWSVGQSLGRDIVYYEVPPALVIRIGTPPPGYRYVRVAADILLIAVGTGMVIDAIADLGSM